MWIQPLVFSALTTVIVAAMVEQDPTEQRWCDALTSLSQTDSRFTLDSGCPHILSVFTESDKQGMNCSTRFQEGKKICTVNYYERTSTTKFLVAYICALPPSQDTSGPGVTGGYNPRDPTDKTYTDLLLDFFDRGVLSAQKMIGVVLTAVNTQVVAGFNYQFTISMNGKTCELLLFVRDWTNTYEAHSDTCHFSVSRARRGLRQIAKDKPSLRPRFS
ncbi:uncharacterized protein LOC128233054 [Mya arenaria]|uniref:uncharacterized protein LOC128233054 n=1 Tax=Mya arenaria TaxID=6604 RepID=UPI0022E33D31|nr:uncharacterized protein LOC128233054 [Mya arenaria]